MRILAVTQYGYPGLTPVSGADVMLHSMLKYLVSRGWEAEAIFLSKDLAQGIYDGVSVRSHHDGGIESAKLLEGAKPDVAITHLGGIQRARTLAKRWGVPLVQLIHNTNDLTIGSLASGTDLAIYNTHWIKSFHETVALGKPFVREWLEPGRSRMRKRVAQSWPSLVLHPPTFHSIALRSSIPSPLPERTRPHVGIVNLSPNKGSDVVRGILDHRPGVNIVGIAGGYDLTKQGVFEAENFIYQEHTSNIAEFYQSIDVLIVPSIYESYSLAAVEAMSFGKPVIASDLPGLRESVADGGVRLDSRDPKVWAEAIDDVFENYDFWCAKARTRHKELYAQTQEELRVFENALKELIDGSDLNGVPGVSPGF